MGWYNVIIYRRMTVDAHIFSWVDAYVACGGATVYHAPTLIVFSMERS